MSFSRHMQWLSSMGGLLSWPLRFLPALRSPPIRGGLQSLEGLLHCQPLQDSCPRPRATSSTNTPATFFRYKAGAAPYIFGASALSCAELACGNFAEILQAPAERSRRFPFLNLWRTLLPARMRELLRLFQEPALLFPRSTPLAACHAA